MGKKRLKVTCRRCGETWADAGVYCRKCADELMLQALRPRPGKKEAPRGRK